MFSPADAPLLATVAEEIEGLHRFFVEWFSGSVPAEPAVFEAGLLTRCDADFILIPPAGNTMSLDDLAQGVRATHGSNPDFRIQIRNVVVRVATDDIVLATYEEWQRNAKASTPPDNGRAASVLFQRAPGRLRWRHVHETWLPADIMQRGPFDF